MKAPNLEILRRRISSEEINAMPIFHYEGPVHLIRSEEDMNEALPNLRKTDVLGFDTETKPTFRKGQVNQPSLVQLATESEVYLVQLSWLPFGTQLAEVLGDSHILKAGVGIRFDMLTLAKLCPFDPQGLVDIGSIAKFNKFSAQGLRTLAAILFGVRISKSSQCSNWSLRELSTKQIVYAATDAWIGRMIYCRMRDLELNFPRTGEKNAKRRKGDVRAEKE